MKLIINADDFGRTRGINYGIVEAMKNGVLSSTTIMMNMPYAEHAVNLAKKEGITSIGVHLTFIEKWISLGKTLVDEHGVFKKYPELMAEADVEEIKTEMRTQIDKLISMGVKPTHLDGHHHVHLYSLKMVEAVFAVAQLHMADFMAQNTAYFVIRHQIHQARINADTAIGHGPSIDVTHLVNLEIQRHTIDAAGQAFFDVVQALAVFAVRSSDIVGLVHLGTRLVGRVAQLSIG